MKYKCLSLLVMMLISTMQVVAMENHQSVQKKSLRKLLIVDQKRIEAHKDHWKNWEKARDSRTKIASSTVLMAGLAYAAFTVYKMYNPEREEVVIKEAATDEEVKGLMLRIANLENHHKPVEDPLPKDWVEWGLKWAKGTLYSGRNLVAGLTCFVAKEALVGAGSSYIMNVLMRSPLESSLLHTGDYFFRPRTTLWLLEKECDLRSALQNIKTIFNSAGSLLQGNPLYHDTVITSINTLVKEAEKIVGHMAFVKDLLSAEKEKDREIAEEIIENVTKTLEQLLKVTEQFLIASDKPFPSIQSFVKCCTSFIKGIELCVSTLLEQMLLFENIQLAAGLSDPSNQLYPTIESLTHILKPQPGTAEGEEEEDMEQKLFKSAKQFLVKEGVKRVLRSIIPPFKATV
ncbi:hypothetical protein H0W26_04955 [Candidatus Dependentiae bacterium]|nr:hypothetical protein [Candidatus Dependentiae bacterium]